MVIASSYLEAAIACDEPVARVLSTQGRVEVQSFGSPIWRKINPEEPLCDGDVVHTGKWSRATIVNASGTGFTLTQNGTLTVSAPPQAEEKQPSWYIKLIQGAAFFRSHHPERHNIQTPFINLVNKGTEFLVEVGDNRTDISVFDGQVVAENKAGKIQINNGQKGTAESNRPPQLQMLKVTPEDAVQWALYYPPIINDTDDGGSDGNSAINLALAAYRQGDVQAALAVLANLPPAQQTPRTLTLQAALLLTVGRLDEAQPLIRQAHQQVPNNSDAFALEAVIAVAKNRGQAALLAANQAVAANPKSPVAHIAQSYAHQAVFDIEAALQATQEALKLAPNNALAWARQAELQLSTGDKAAALAAASKAQALNPRLARSQIVLGFANLAQTQLDEAKSAFQQALTLDSTDPLARLGLGLAKIRRGDLDAGKIDLESAVNLDPNNAVARSYLGKAYYELRNKDFASKEFEIAKMMDSKDPTPYFYDAILKQTTNRPVEALSDMQKAIDLNDNRAIYRSSLLLDKDLAARSAAQGRIYSDLGYQRLGLVEAWKSVSSDPSNYSAHRLLADNYSSQPRHDIARVSELLQSQLLQPINLTPVQPQLGEKNLLSIGSAGPASTSFNEFNPLFTSDRFTLQTSGVVGSNDTYGDEAVHSGLWRNFSYSLGQYHYQSGGFRTNNDVNVDILNGFIQASLTSNLSVQAEYRHREFDRGDVDMLADGFFSSDIRLRTKNDTYRGGLHYSISPNSEVIGSYIHSDSENFSQQPEAGDFGTLTNINGEQGEAQHLFHSEYISTISGIGVAESGVTAKDLEFNESLSHINGYIYTYTHYPREFDWTLGISVDSLEVISSGETTESKQINPKAGLLWRANKDLTFRTAISRTLKRSLITNQTIEPTQVAGFNQFYDDYTFTDAWLYGVAVDKKWDSQVFGGLEFIARDLSLLALSEKWDEHNYRAYLNWNITPQLAATLNFHLEEFKGGVPSSVVPESITTYDSKVGLRYFHPSGFFCNFETEYVNQKTSWPDAFDDQDESTPATAVVHNNFFVLNAGLGFRLPKRMGVLQFEIKNILGDQFNYQSIGGRSPGFTGDAGQPPPFIPGRTFFGRITLAF